MENIDIPRDYAPKVPGGVLSEEYGIDANSDSEISESHNNEEIDNSLDEKKHFKHNEIMFDCKAT